MQTKLSSFDWLLFQIEFTIQKECIEQHAHSINLEINITQLLFLVVLDIYRPPIYFTFDRNVLNRLSYRVEIQEELQRI